MTGAAVSLALLERPPGRTAASLHAVILLAVATVIGTDQAFVLLLAWETLTVAIYLLAAAGRDRPGSLADAYFGGALSKLGGACLLAAFALLYGRTGSFELSVWAHGGRHARRRPQRRVRPATRRLRLEDRTPAAAGRPATPVQRGPGSLGGDDLDRLQRRLLRALAARLPDPRAGAGVVGRDRHRARRPRSARRHPLRRHPGRDCPVPRVLQRRARGDHPARVRRRPARPIRGRAEPRRGRATRRDAAPRHARGGQDPGLHRRRPRRGRDG